jgi:rubrerythrin
MIEGSRIETYGVPDYVEFLAAGDAAAGEFRCSECGYGVTITHELPRCPMCSSTTWEQVPWSPFLRERLH